MNVNPFDFRTLQYPVDATYNMRAPITNQKAVEVWFKGVEVPPTHPVYGYQILPDPDRVVENYTFSKIVFNQPVRLIRPLVEVNYITRQSFCLQCNGTGQVTDWQVSAAGTLTRCYGKQKLAQQSIKYLLTSTNPFTPSLVCQLRNFIGKRYGSQLTNSDIEATVNQILASYQQIQQAQKTVQTMTPHEVLQSVVSVMAEQDSNDPTVVYVSVVVATAAGQDDPLPLNIALQSTN